LINSRAAIPFAKRALWLRKPQSGSTGPWQKRPLFLLLEQENNRPDLARRHGFVRSKAKGVAVVRATRPL
jgi:hypothetical protein